MITQSSIPDQARVLSNRMTALNMMTNIPSMRQYAEAWNKLGAEFKAIGYTSNSERCYKRFEHYIQQAANEPEPPATTPAQPYRYLYCETCKTWTQHALNMTGDTYVCGCGSQVEYSIEAAERR